MVGLGPGVILLDLGPSPHTERGTAAPDFSSHFAVARSPILATAELLSVVHISCLQVETCDHTSRRNDAADVLSNSNDVITGNCVVDVKQVYTFLSRGFVT